MIWPDKPLIILFQKIAIVNFAFMVILMSYKIKKESNLNPGPILQQILHNFIMCQHCSSTRQDNADNKRS